MTASLKPSIPRRIAGVTVGIALALLAVEWGFRLALALGIVKADIWPLIDADVERAIHRYSDDPALVYECRPGASTVKDGVLLEINAEGFRGRDFPVARRQGVRRVAVLGDSVTFAAAVPDEQTFVSQAQRRLGDAWELFNFGVTGYNSDQERIVLDRKVRRFTPDVIVVGYCMNDLSPTDGLGELAMASHPSKWGPRLHSHLVTYLSDQADRRRSWRDRSFDRPARLFERLGTLTAGGGLGALVVLFPQLDEERTGWHRPEEYDRARELAVAAGLEVVDVRRAMDQVPAAERGKLYVDRTHFSEAGHALCADLLASALRPGAGAK